MKIFKISFLLIIFLSIMPTFATFIEPEWSDFCPSEYLNLENKQYIIPEKNYWVQRRNDFENKKQMCRAQDNKDACFNELRQSELSKNNLYFSQKNLEARERENDYLFNSLYMYRYD